MLAAILADADVIAAGEGIDGERAGKRALNEQRLFTKQWN
jgi:hypothetical protein